MEKILNKDSKKKPKEFTLSGFLFAMKDVFTGH